MVAMRRIIIAIVCLLGCAVMADQVFMRPVYHQRASGGVTPPAAQSYPLAGNIVAQWDFQDLTGSVTSDSTSNDLDLTVSGAVWTNVAVSSLGYTNKAYYYDGVNDVAYDYFSPSVRQYLSNGVGTISLWVNAASFVNLDKYFAVGASNSASFYLGFEQAGGTNTRMICVNTNGGTSSILASGDLGTWHHYLGVFTGTNVGEGQFLYYDGVFASSNTTDADRTWFDTRFNEAGPNMVISLGAQLGGTATPANPSREVECTIDNVAIWNISLTNAADRDKVFSISHPTNDLHIGVQP
jgi:hypothetical protein